MHSFLAAFNDLKAGISDWYFWGYLGWSDIRQRYRRSFIGPFWLTLSSTIFIFAISMVYSRLFKMNLKEYLPFLATGYIIWTFIAAVVIDSTTVFIEAGEYIKEVKLPLTLFATRILWRNFLIFLHSFLVILGVYVVFKFNPGLNFLWLIPGCLLVLINLEWIIIFLGILGVRFRDITPIVQSSIQVLFFISPIAWMPKLVGEQSLVLLLNPINYFIHIMRDPMLGLVPPLSSWLVMIGFAVVGWAITLVLYSGTYKKVVFWL